IERYRISRAIEKKFPAGREIAASLLPRRPRRPIMASAAGEGRRMRIGFVGTGTMGTPIAGCLVAAGHRLTVYDARPEAMSALIGHGAATADSPSEAAYAAEVVFTSLPGPSEVEAAALDPNRGIFAGLRRGGTYIDLTTNAPATVRRVAEAARKREVV